MNNLSQCLAETTAFIRSKTHVVPYIGYLTGTGLGDSAESMTVDTAIEYRNIPHFPISTVQSHKGRLLIGRLVDCPLIVLQGRFHLYEGYSPKEVTYPVRLMQQLGVKILILSNAAGGLNPSFSPGDIMLISDHINLTLTNPLIGPNDDDLGVRFPDMSRAYNLELISTAEDAARAAGIRLQKGIYVGLIGPALETPAEVEFLETIGAEAVGFSTVQEVIAAVHGGLRVMGLSVITNVHNPADPVPASVEEIIAVAQKAAPSLGTILRGVAGKIYETEIR
ncbi:MAG: purine-nucleoside phosphorylase [Deltaproteobacteria bacterium]|jgi:purine-nucleoside phosphorylase|nr:purine-nucleoside phosphorylase [Deltaproteobacteria bacterium]